MANAAAKKASSARESASSLYKPVLIVINILYCTIVVVWYKSSISVKQVLVSIVLWVLTVVAYRGIVDDHANKVSMSNKMRSSSSLPGGSSLDLLGIVLVIQFGSVLVSTNFYWMLTLLPLWGLYQLYSTFFRGKEDPSLKTTESEKTHVPNDEIAKAKRQKRAEKRRQKWS